MEIIVSLLLFIAVYAVTHLLLSKVPSLQSIAEVLAIVIGVLVALGYVGVIGA